jgi:hypothetical protein
MRRGSVLDLGSKGSSTVDNVAIPVGNASAHGINGTIGAGGFHVTSHVRRGTIAGGIVAAASTHGAETGAGFALQWNSTVGGRSNGAIDRFHLSA